MSERTLSILKPDATRRNLTGKINAVIEDAGLRIVAQRRLRLSRDDAERFYDVHKGKPFFDDLVGFMTSGPVVVQVLEGEGAVARYPTMSASVKNCAISIVAVSGLSEPCTELPVKLSA